MRKVGGILLVLGILSFVLPFVGLQIKGLHLMPAGAQALCGIVMIAAGAFCLIASSGGILAGLLAAGVGAVILLFVARTALNSGMFNDNANAIAAAPPQAGPNFPPPNQPGPNPGMPLIGQSRPAEPSASKIHVVLSNGRSSPSTSLLGTRTMGVSFHADYTMQGHRPAGVMKYETIIRGPRVRATDHFSMLHHSGEINLAGMTFQQSDGPFEMYIEAQFAGAGGFRSERVSEIIPLPWHEPPAQQPNQPGFGPRGGFPQPGGMPNGNMPGMPNNPGRPNFGPPGGFPRGPGMPPFGPRGRGM